MKIKEVFIKNYKNIGVIDGCTIKFPHSAESSDMLTIIGENNVGKSTVLEALRMFFPHDKPNCPSLDRFPGKKPPIQDNASEHMEIRIVFHEFNEGDLRKPEISRYIYNGELQLKKTWVAPDLADKDVSYYAYIKKYTIVGLLEGSTWNNAAFSNLSEELQELHRRFCAENNLSSGTILQGKKNDFINYIVENGDEELYSAELVWMENPNGLSSVIRSIMPLVIYIPAMKLLEDETNTSKSNSAAKKIISSLIENNMRGTQKFIEFETAVSNLTNEFVGENRNSSLNDLEDSINSKLNRLMDIKAIVDFNPPTFEKLHENATFLLKYNDIETTTDNQGSGAQRLLILSLLELIAEQLNDNPLDSQNMEGDSLENLPWQRSYLFLVEEPEIYLHPHLQRKMRDSLLKISESEFSQVICTSHSEHFIDLADRHQGIIIAKRCEETSTTKFLQVEEDLYSGDNSVDKRNSMRMLLNFNSSTLESFFSKRVVLVEGDCEIASFKAIKDEIIRRYPALKEDIENVCADVNLISCKGKLTQRTYCEVLSHFGISPVLIHDLDDEERDVGNNLRMLESIECNESRRLCHHPNFEMDIFEQEWSNDKPWRATKIITESFDTYESKLLRFFYFVIGETSASKIRRLISS